MSRETLQPRIPDLSKEEIHLGLGKPRNEDNRHIQFRQCRPLVFVCSDHRIGPAVVPLLDPTRKEVLLLVPYRGCSVPHDGIRDILRNSLQEDQIGFTRGEDGKGRNR